MAQIVLIAAATARRGSEVGDVVAVHDDKTDLTGPGYEAFDIVQATNLTKPEVSEIFAGVIPETKVVWRDADGSWYDLPRRNKHPDEDERGKEIWLDEDAQLWREVKEPPRHHVNLGRLDAFDRKALLVGPRSEALAVLTSRTDNSMVRHAGNLESVIEVTPLGN